MEINNNFLNNLLKQTDCEFESRGLFLTTTSPEEDGFYIEVRYNIDSNELEDMSFYFGDIEVNVTYDQLDIIYKYLVKLYEDEMFSIEEYKKRSCDDEYEDRGINPMMFI